MGLVGKGESWGRVGVGLGRAWISILEQPRLKKPVSEHLQTISWIPSASVPNCHREKLQVRDWFFTTTGAGALGRSTRKKKKKQYQYWSSFPRKCQRIPPIYCQYWRKLLVTFLVSLKAPIKSQDMTHCPWEQWECPVWDRHSWKLVLLSCIPCSAQICQIKFLEVQTWHWHWHLIQIRSFPEQNLTLTLFLKCFPCTWSEK